MAGAAGNNRGVAVLGAGIMGSAMTRNLVVAGFDTVVWPTRARGSRRRRQTPYGTRG